MTCLLYKMTRPADAGPTAMQRGYRRSSATSRSATRPALGPLPHHGRRVPHPPGFPYPPPGHPGGYQFDWQKGRVLHEYQIVYISPGQGRLEMGRQRWRIGPGTRLPAPPRARGTATARTPRPGGASTGSAATVPWCAASSGSGFFSPQRPVLQVRDEDLLLGAFSSVIDAIHAGRPALQQVAAGATLYILSLLYSALQPGQDGPPGVSRAIHEAMRRWRTPPRTSAPFRAWPAAWA